jgi:flagellar protein FliS
MEYLRTKVLTASPEELHLMLYDGAIRFAETGKTALQNNDLEKSHEAIVRSQHIVLEMISGLDHNVNPSLCAKLSSLYNFIYRRLVEANLRRSTTAIDDALRILNYQRETWVLLMEKIVSGQQAETALTEKTSTPQDPNPEQTQNQPGMSLSLSA